jgi:3-phosphoshikimate 1-carboxyvinyltransferase
MALELGKLGVKVTEEKDGLIIQEVHMEVWWKAMETIVWLCPYSGRVGHRGVRIQNASAYQVSFPNFPQVMEGLGCPVEIV